MFLKNFRNRIDFYLRNTIRFSRALPTNFSPPLGDQKLQREFGEFLALFEWAVLLQERPRGKIEIVDVGARNFAFAPVLDVFFRKHLLDPTVHGVEIDAYRLLAGFHSRKDFGDFYAKQIPHGFYHAMDFLNWERPLDIVFMLNPFVTTNPLLAWGLPTSQWHPADLFDHCNTILKPKNGLLFISSPSQKEFDLSQKLAQSSGFKELQNVLWEPSLESIQQQPRFGAVYTLLK